MSLNTKPNVPLPYPQIDGLRLSWLSTTTLSVSSGSGWDSTNTWGMSLSSVSTLNAANNGINGLDTGSLAASTRYYVFIISDPAVVTNPTGSLLSLSKTAPTMPFGYSILKYIGTVLTDGSSHFLPFYQSGSSSTRHYQYATPIAVLTGGSATSFTAVSLAAAMPLQATPVTLQAAYTPALVANTVNLRPTGSTAAAGSCPVILKNSAAALGNSQVQIIPQLATGNPSIDYIATASDAVTLSVVGFEDYI